MGRSHPFHTADPAPHRDGIVSKFPLATGGVASYGNRHREFDLDLGHYGAGGQQPEPGQCGAASISAGARYRLLSAHRGRVLRTRPSRPSSQRSGIRDFTGNQPAAFHRRPDHCHGFPLADCQQHC